MTSFPKRGKDVRNLYSLKFLIFESIDDTNAHVVDRSKFYPE